MIARTHNPNGKQSGPPETSTPIQITLNLQLPESMEQMLMQLLTRATLSPQSSDVETTQPRLFPECELEPPPAESNPGSSESKPQSSESIVPSLESNAASAESMLNMLLNAPVSLARKRRKASKQQQTAHETSARMFDRWHQTLHRSTEPVQGLLDWLKADALLLDPSIRRDFCAWALQQKNPRTKQLLSPQTVKTYWQHCVMVCRAYGVSLEQWTLHEIKLLRDEVTGNDSTAIVVERRTPTAEELDAIALHSSVVSTPYGEHSAYFFRGLVRFMAYSGLRTRDVVSCVTSKTGLRKQDIVWDVACPSPNVNAALGYTLESPGGWVWIRVGKAAKSETPVMLLPIPMWARGWLRFFCELSHDPVRVFPSAQRGSVSLSQAAFSNAWNQIIAAAGVSPNIRLSEGAGGIIAIRKYPANWWSLAVQARKSDTELADMVSDYLLHHASVRKSTGDRHYRDIMVKVLPTILELLPAFPKPAADATPVSLLPE